ncbi:hypothetical protein BGZ76_008649 [Entomortierella beljakovae]|nr:hypothetical protein BGZ76_008649 [Entomortierella beljakovae]
MANATQVKQRKVEKQQENNNTNTNIEREEKKPKNSNASNGQSKKLARKQIVLTQKQLAQYDGTDLSKPIYIAIMGEVFDVTNGRSYYARGGGYGFFSGRDASRAYTTGCFETHLTHDIRGLTPEQLQDIEGWAKFYRDHRKYFRVGTVILDPIDPSSPIPEDCRQPTGQKP